MKIVIVILLLHSVGKRMCRVGWEERERGVLFVYALAV